MNYAVSGKTNSAIKKQSSVIDSDFITSVGDVALQKLKTSLKGLSEKEAEKRLDEYGFNEPAKKKKRTIIFQIFSKFFNPLVLVLLVIASFSLFFGEKISALLVGLMAVMSVLLSFIQEYRAGKEAERLSEMVRATATVIRSGTSHEVKIRELVPGDIVDLCAGDMIPADLRIISSKDLFINQASLTGEAFPIEKFPYPVDIKQGNFSELSNIAFMGSSVVSGTALGLVIKTGVGTQFGELSRRLTAIRVETNFDKGVNKFMMLMIRVMLVLVGIIFAINALTRGNVIEAFLFSLGVAVGLTPEMLPMIVTINLSKGAIAMSKKQVIVKRLNSIQNFGAMDVLCTDKTGTLTMDKIVLEKHCDVARNEDDDVLRHAYINSFYQTGLKNILDQAILKHGEILVKQYTKVDEIPFDFSRRIMSVIVDMDGDNRLIAKGAPEEIFRRCKKFELEDELFDLTDMILTDLKEEYKNLSSAGYRVLALAYKDTDKSRNIYSRDDEIDLILKGYVAFLDPPKPTTQKTLEAIKNLGIEVKVLTGDNELVTKKICTDVGLDIKGLVTGEQITAMDDDELRKLVQEATVFARLSPLQKERVVTALHDNGHIVGFLGDGINDAAALKVSDVGISVNNAVDIAKESADIILLKKSLMVLEDGVIEGRRTFCNIVKYIKMGSSSNYGNMFSMTGASLFLPFLPMIPIQILLNNFLYDLSQVSIPSDNVDEEYLKKPRNWDVTHIKRFMLVIGPVSSIFDFLTFFVMLFVFHAGQELFRTGWFLESLTTQTLVIYVIRTKKIPFLESCPSKFVVLTSLLIVLSGFLLVYSPLAKYFHFVHLPAGYFGVLFLIIVVYLVLTHFVKNWFLKKYNYD